MRLLRTNNCNRKKIKIQKKMSLLLHNNSIRKKYKFNKKCKIK